MIIKRGASKWKIDYWIDVILYSVPYHNEVYEPVNLYELIVKIYENYESPRNGRKEWLKAEADFFLLLNNKPNKELKTNQSIYEFIHYELISKGLFAKNGKNNELYDITKKGIEVKEIGSYRSYKNIKNNELKLLSNQYKFNFWVMFGAIVTSLFAAITFIDNKFYNKQNERLKDTLYIYSHRIDTLKTILNIPQDDSQ